jgi:hypothetical protein
MQIFPALQKSQGSNDIPVLSSAKSISRQGFASPEDHLLEKARENAGRNFYPEKSLFEIKRGWADKSLAGGKPHHDCEPCRHL